MFATDVVILPCSPSGLDLAVTAALVKILKQVRKARKDHGLPQAYFVANRVQTNTKLARELLEAAQDIGVPMVERPIHLRQAFALAPTVRKSVFD